MKFAIAIGCGVFFYFFINRILITDSAKRKKYENLILGLVILFIIGILLFIEFYGNTNIGSYFEKKEYRVKYYVLLFQEESKTFNYKLPALIYSNVISDEEGGKRIYYLEKVFFPNGKILTFNEYNYEVTTEEDGLQIGEKRHYRDNSGINWKVELTNQKVNN